MDATSVILPGQRAQVVSTLDIIVTESAARATGSAGTGR